VVVVGASLAGLRCAEALRKAGFDGHVDIVGDEPHMPYNRPPLSKERLGGDATAEWLRRSAETEEVTWRLGSPAVAADLGRGTLELASGKTLHWDGLVAATGLRPRRLPLPGTGAGRHVLRGLDDANALRAALGTARRIVVIGAGFIGCEIAALAAGSGIETHAVAPESVPLERPCGQLLGKEVQRRLEDLGVRFHLGLLPHSCLGTGRIAGVALSDGTEITADLVVEAAGSLPNVEGLEGNGLGLSDGLPGDGQLRVTGHSRVVACGDLARFPNPLFDQVPRRVEHWFTAVDTAKRAGTTLADTLAGRAPADTPFAPVPSFWSHQQTVRIQSFGAPGLGGGDIRVLEGDLSGDVAVGYHRDGRLVGVVLLGLARRYAHYRKQITTALAGAQEAVR